LVSGISIPQHDPEYIAQLESELGRRGVVGFKRGVLEYLTASALWWNIIWWEWVALDGRSVLLGWIQNLIVLGIAAAVLGYLLGPTAAAIGVLLLHGTTLWLGLSLRRGTKLDKAPT
jgi:hypothetical protein